MPSTPRDDPMAAVMAAERPSGAARSDALGLSSRIAALAFNRENRPDDALAALVRRLRARSLTVGGLLQRGRYGESERCATLHLEDIDTGRRVQIFEQRGRMARGCKLDHSGLDVARAWLSDAIARSPDVVFV